MVHDSKKTSWKLSPKNVKVPEVPQFSMKMDVLKERGCICTGPSFSVLRPDSTKSTSPKKILSTDEN